MPGGYCWLTLQRGAWSTWTILVCVGITLGNKTYIGGIGYPYISDTESSPTTRPIFATGMTLAALALIANYALMKGAIDQRIAAMARAAHAPSAHVARCNLAAAILGVLGSLCAALLAVFDTLDYPSVHNLSAYAFFLFTVSAVSLHTFIASRVARDTYRCKLALNVILAVAFIIYIPVGLALLSPWQRLSMDGCTSYYTSNVGMAEKAADAFCKSVALPTDPTKVLFWDYSSQAGVNTVRAVSQHVCVLCVLGYVFAFYADLKHDAREDDAAKAATQDEAAGAMELPAADVVAGRV